MIKKFCVVCAFTVAGAAQVSAQDVSYGTFGLSYSVTEFDEERVNLLSGRGELGIQMGTVDLFVGAAVNQLDETDLPTIELRDLSFGAGWEFVPNFRGDLSYNNASFGVGEVSLSLSFTEAGIGYDGENVYGRVSYARVNEGELGLRALYGAVIGYGIGDEFDSSLSVHFVDERSDTLNDPLYIANVSYYAETFGVSADLAQYDIDGVSARLVSVSGQYNFTYDWGLRGSYSNASLNESGGDGRISFDRGSLGVDYRAFETTNVFADVTYTSASYRDFGTTTSEDGWGITAGVRFDLGGQNRRRVTTRDRIDRALRSVNGF